MKSVGQQLQEARLARNWTPELASRETKIKADRVRDLEADNYANFSSPTYARGFVRTYARALGLDEYRILRQLDNKLPEDDNASFADDHGSMPYAPESTTQALHVSSAPRTGLYVVSGLGFAVALIIAFVMLQAYRAGELQRYFASSSTLDSAAAQPASVAADSEAPPHATAVDPNDTTHAAKALPVDLNALPPEPAPGSSGGTNVVAAAEPAGDAPATAPGAAPRALPVDPTAAENPTAAGQAGPVVVPGSPSTETSPAATEAHAPLRALPVDPAELATDNQSSTAGGPINPASPPTQEPAVGAASPAAKAAPAAAAQGPKPLILTASRDSAIRVTSLDSPSRAVLYDSVLRSGQSLEFDGRKFSINVANPSAVAIMLDGVNYGPHSEHDSPQTFNLESHQP